MIFAKTQLIYFSPASGFLKKVIKMSMLAKFSRAKDNFSAIKIKCSDQIVLRMFELRLYSPIHNSARFVGASCAASLMRCMEPGHTHSGSAPGPNCACARPVQRMREMEQNAWTDPALC